MPAAYPEPPSRETGLARLLELDRLVGRRDRGRGVIPVTREGWGVALEAVAGHGIESAVHSLIHASSRLESGEPGEAADLQGHDLEETCDLGTLLITDLDLLESFAPAAGRAAQLSRTCYELIAAAFERVDPHRLESRREAVKCALHALLESAPDGAVFVDEPFEAALGISRDDLVGADGRILQGRLMALVRPRTTEFEARLARVVSAVTNHPMRSISAILPAIALLDSESPLVTIRAATHVRSLVLTKSAGGAEQAAEALRPMIQGVDRAAASLESLRVNAADDGTQRGAKRAYRALGVHKRLVEGQLRHSMWAVVRLHDPRAGERPPTLGRLGQQLRESPDRLLREASDSMLPMARNAEAHEDYYWDDDHEVLRIGAESITLDELDSAIAFASAIVAGVEAGIRCARSENVRLASLLDQHGRASGAVVVGRTEAVDRLGANGLLVTQFDVRRGELMIDVETLHVGLVDPLFQALTEAAVLLKNGIERITVRAVGGNEGYITVPRRVADANMRVLRQARANFRVMPGTTFLPLNLAARLAVEEPAIAAQSISWLAVNAILLAEEQIDDAVGAQERRRQLVEHVRLGSRSLDVVALTSNNVDGGIRQAHTILRSALQRVGRTRGGGLDQSSWDALWKIHDALPPASVMPTVDPSPLA